MNITRPLSLSPSKVDTFNGCPRLFKYKYIKPPIPVVENKYFLIGNIAHKALEMFHTIELNGNMSVIMKDCFKSAIEKHHADEKIKKGIIVKDDLYLIRDMLKKYIQYIQKTGAPLVMQCEKLIKIPLSKNVVIWMKADRLDKEGTVYKVIDYKTSARPATRKEELASVQIPTYGLWVRQAYGKDALVYGEYQYLRHIDKKGIHTFEVTDEMMESAKEEYERIADKLLSGCLYIQNFKYKYCRNCDFRSYCVEDESDGL